MSLLGIYIMDDFIPETPGLVQMSFLLSYLGLFNFLLGKYPCSAIEQTTATNIRFFHCLSASFLEGTTSWPTMAHPYHHDNLRVPLPNPNPTTTPPGQEIRPFFKGFMVGAEKFLGWERLVAFVEGGGNVVPLRFPWSHVIPGSSWPLNAPVLKANLYVEDNHCHPHPRKKKMVEWIYTNKWWALEKRMSGFNCGVSG